MSRFRNTGNNPQGTIDFVTTLPVDIVTGPRYAAQFNELFGQMPYQHSSAPWRADCMFGDGICRRGLRCFCPFGLAMSQPLPTCQFYYTKLVSLRNAESALRLEHVAMCRLRQSLNTDSPLQQIQRRQIICNAARWPRCVRCRLLRIQRSISLPVPQASSLRLATCHHALNVA